MRRPIGLLLVVALAVGACSTTDRPPIERVSGTIGASNSAASTTGGIGGTGGAGSTGGGPTTGGGETGGGSAGSAATDRTGVSGATAEDPSGSSAAAGAATTGSANGSVATAQPATVALDAYLDALQAEDFAGAQRVSGGGTAFMARVREVVSRYNKERDGVTSLTYSSRSFQVASATATRVTFTGQAKLESTTSGPAGPPQKESALFANPTVTLSGGAWRVADLRYNGQPLGFFPASSHRELGGVDLRLPGALSFGSSTGLIIDLVSDGDHSIKVDKATLHYADGSTGVPKLGALVSKKPAALYFLFDRTSSPPTSWTATVTIDGGTSKQVTANVTLGF